MTKTRKTKRKPVMGRPRGVEMPCGWKCGAKLTNAELRTHFVECPNRPDVELKLYQAAQDATDEVFGKGTYLKVNGFDPSKGKPRPAVRVLKGKV